ncbi:hypothetical protein D3C71_1766040 [compost metagenome]
MPGSQDQLLRCLLDVGRKRIQGSPCLYTSHDFLFHACLQRGFFRFGHGVQFDGFQQQIRVAVGFQKRDRLVETRKQFVVQRSRRRCPRRVY